MSTGVVRVDQRYEAEWNELVRRYDGDTWLAASVCINRVLQGIHEGLFEWQGETAESKPTEEAS